jgi:hypothetical protein
LLRCIGRSRSAANLISPGLQVGARAALKKVRASTPKRIYAPRIVSDHIMVQEDFERLHKFLLETEGLSEVSDDMRQLIEGAKAAPEGVVVRLIYY